MLKLDHVGIAVKDLDKAVKCYQKMFRIKDYDEWRVEGHGNDTAFLTIYEKLGPKPVENVSFEIMAPIKEAEKSDIRDHIEEKGEGLYHLAFMAEDFDRAIAYLKQIRDLDLELLEPEGTYKHAMIHPCAYTSYVRIYIYNEKYEPNE